MILKDIKSFYKLISEITGKPYYVVKHVIEEGQFKYMKDWMKDPEKPALRLENLGTIETRLDVVTADLKLQLLPALRDPKRRKPYTIDKFRFLWQLRKKTIEFLKKTKKKKKNGSTKTNRKNDGRREGSDANSGTGKSDLPESR